MSVEDVAARLQGALAQPGEELATLHLPRIEILGETAQTQKSQRLSSTLDHAGVGIVEVDAEGRLLRVNRHLCALMGCGPEDLVGRSIFDESFAEDGGTDRARFQRQVAGEIDRYTIEKQIRRKDGSSFWASVDSCSVLDPAGHFLYAVRVQHDITDRKRAEAALARRAEEQSALFDFTDAMQQAHAPEQVHEAALDAILRALRCDRASILLADDAQVMRFVTARGLSDTYKRAVEGHSPWSPDEQQPQPVTIPDLRRSDLPEDLRASIEAEGIAAVAFIPLRQNRRLLGKFMAYYDTPHAFTEPEINIALTLARQLGFGLERMQAERAAQRLAAIVASSDDAIISKSLDGIIQTWNGGAERIFGYTAQEAIGQPVSILIPQDRQNEEPQILARIRAGERVDHFETIRQREDGRLIDISLSISPIRDEWGRIMGASKIARDITEKKEAEAKLRHNEQQLKDLLAAIPAAIYTTDAEGRVTYYNEKAVELAGRVPVIGSDEWCVTWKLFWPDGTPLPHDQCPMAVALKEGRAIRDAEAVAERPDGTRVPFIPYPTPLRDENGRVIGAINMLVDISERKQAETQQRILLNELNHRVKNNMQMLQSLLANAARNTQNPEAREVLGEASDRLAAMSAAQRVLYGTTDATRFDGEEFLDAVCKTAQHAFPDDVRIESRSNVGQLPNDAAMPLALILNELMTNAVKHGLKGQAGTIQIALEREGDAFVLCVADGGPGFDLDTVKRRSSGLQLVQGLARQLRGRFEVQRDPTRCVLHFT
ncbi:PAS domain S-box protein [Dongia sedimenti]|uniref:histidine kinase n=1 Tax=Dongia sedimenti TaxID=3064282 RepID=A0ABU0YJV4_9PROT|nr:PAS domain S-box protein [Rhodospirillaceae bacterium R-7]